MADEAIELTELVSMRAVVHPARWKVLQQLYAGHTLTATQAAQLTGLTPSAMSYHLKQLAKAGLIERDDSSDGREHPWRAIGKGFRLSAKPDAESGSAMMRNVLATISQLLLAPPPVAGEERVWPASFSQSGFKLTKERAKVLHARIQEVIEEFEAEPEEDGQEYEFFWLQGVKPSGDGIGTALASGQESDGGRREALPQPKAA
ncbi:MAG: helix-turn-helix domain-containing protein [Actinobacteria bacterium]|nr:helix-turn-helix domain-containing protein [Actinomycetota bacterium]